MSSEVKPNEIKQRLEGPGALARVKIRDRLTSLGRVTGTNVHDEDLAAACDLTYMLTPKHRNEWRVWTLRACRDVLKETGVYWKRLCGAMSLRCLEATETLEVGRSDRRHVHRTSNLSVLKLNSIDVASLDEKQRSSARVECAQMATIASMSSTLATKQMESRNMQTALPLDHLFEVMKTEAKT